MARYLVVGLLLVAAQARNPLPPPPGYPNHQACTERQVREQWTCADPIILPVGADKRAIRREDYQLTDFLHGVRFDLNGDGIEEQVSWTAQGSHLAFLAMDRDGNGKIDNGKELFSNFTDIGWPSGFEALRFHTARMTESQREMAAGWGNPFYEKLLLWEDDNHDGVSQAEEIYKLSDHYLAIDAICEFDPLTDKWGNQFLCRGSAAVKERGMTRMPYGRRDLYIPIYDVLLRGR